MMFWLLLVLALVNTALAKVSPSFNDCLGTFYGTNPPQGFDQLSSKANAITPLCLMLENQNNPFYASLYHKELRYPLYAAYILDIRPDDPKGSSKTFRLEPQLTSVLIDAKCNRGKDRVPWGVEGSIPSTPQGTLSFPLLHFTSIITLVKHRREL
ncbi:endonuclease domain-containing 1 -like [Pelobates cultripes]|uniref:Endonuclease domain-containing 1 -like n=1 Tax=Pelobates cultripes TaxID=61616 RepID=A0AAD1T578_PELCU|nr:endonuclease domain-containing 1 -like [Pelobates cultripes]